MLTVEQVKTLDGKVHKALALIESQKNENSMLKAKLDEYKQRVEQLESVLDGFKLEQLEIEEGIKDVLTQLDQLEDQITEPSPSSIVNSEPAMPQQSTIEPVSNSLSEQSPGTQNFEAPSVIEQPQKAEEIIEDPAVQVPELEIF